MESYTIVRPPLFEEALLILFLGLHCSLHAIVLLIYYPPEVRAREYWGLGVFLLQYFPRPYIIILHHNCIDMNIGE